MRFIKRVLLFVFIVILIMLSILTAGGWGKYKQALSQLPLQTAANNIRAQETFTAIDDISLTFVNAMVAIEDRRFYKHKGIDFIGVIRAVAKNIEERDFVEGGSCITQQLAKNLYYMGDDSISRKIAEIFTAVQIEKTFSKREILELYFNVIYYGSGYYSIGEATIGYFGKSPYDITDYEATLLAGIPNAPSVYSLNNKPELAKQRQKKVIQAMRKMKYLTKEEADMLLSENK